MVRLLFWLVALPNLFATACVALISATVENPAGLRSLVVLYPVLVCFPLMLFGPQLPVFVREWVCLTADRAGDQAH